MDTLALSVAQFLLFSAFELVFNNFFFWFGRGKNISVGPKIFFFSNDCKIAYEVGLENLQAIFSCTYTTKGVFR